MQEFHQVEIVVNLFLQGLASWLIAPMSFFSFLGSEEFFLLVMPFIYWCVSPLLGLKLGIILGFSNATNMVLKLTFHNPRPYWIDSRVQSWSSESSFGIPSNHVQTAVTLWGYTAGVINRPWAVPAYVVVIVCIGVSRLYLGAHFLSDILAGWLIGGLLLLLISRIEAPVTAWVKKASLERLLTAALACSLGIMLLIALSGLTLQSWQLPPEWVSTALTASPQAPIDPLDLTAAFTLGGTVLGVLGGGAYNYRKAGGCSAEGPLRHKLFRYLLGGLGLFLLWYGLGKVFPRDASPLSDGLRFLRYVLIGSWITFFAPLLFQRLGWMKRAV